MLKALFLDLDETLCDTVSANQKARHLLINKLTELLADSIKSEKLADNYLKGIYKIFDEEMKKLFLPISCEETFRNNLLKYLFEKENITTDFSMELIDSLRQEFDENRMQHFDFFPGVKELLCDLRKEYKLVVITNGPTYSQYPKVEKVKVRDLVDFIIIGGEEPEEKPHKSIFYKGCELVQVEPAHVLHVGDSLNADIQGAKNAGLKAVWISPTLEKNNLADHTIATFTDLPRILNTYSK